MGQKREYALRAANFWGNERKKKSAMKNEMLIKNSSPTKYGTIFETAYLSAVWSTILERVNSVSKRLQGVNICLADVVELYESLIEFVQTNRSLNLSKPIAH